MPRGGSVFAPDLARLAQVNQLASRASGVPIGPQPPGPGPIAVSPAQTSGFANLLALAQASQTPIAAPTFQDRRETGVEVAGDLAQSLAAAYANRRREQRQGEAQAEAVNQVSTAIKAGNPAALTAPDTMAAIAALPADSPVVRLWEQAVAPPPPQDMNKLIVTGPDGKPMVNQQLLDARKELATAGRTNINIGDSPPPITPPPNLEQFTAGQEEDIDILQGTGASGAFAGVVNPLGDILFGQLPRPEADRARNRLRRMRTEGAAVLSTASGLVGRDSNQTRQQFQKLFPEVGSLTQGDLGALNNMIEARQLVADILADVQQQMTPDLWATAGQSKRDNLTSSGVKMASLFGQLDRMIEGARAQALPDWRSFDQSAAREFLNSEASSLLNVQELDELAAIAGLE